MSRKLPARPNLEHLRTQAKALLGKIREGDAHAAQSIAPFLPEGRKREELRLADVQGALARKSGFARWPSLARYVERLRSLEGKWAFRSLEIDGQPVPPAALSASALLIDGDRFRMESPEGSYEGIFTIDVEATPHRIDIDFVEGPEAGNRVEGLFDLDGDRFRLCLGLVGSARPQRFATEPGSGHALEELLRVDRARPAGVEGGVPPPQEPPPPTPSDPGDFDDLSSPILQKPAQAGVAPNHVQELVCAVRPGALCGRVLQKLQGEWIPIEMITSGAPMQASFLPYGVRVHHGV
ncbi:MAG: TIGR03067 domain-containing protein, partial [Bryobacterales bacterium]|nr:TIGR03067 domain-containing protein [Bryobacterales bacterium]